MPTPKKNTNEGHDQGDTVQDAYAMSNEDFASALADARSGELPHDDAPDDTDPLGDTASDDHATPDDTGQAGGTKDDAPRDTSPPPFELEPEPTATDAGSEKGKADAEHLEIVHNGQVHRITREKAVELAQKGFDYDTKVGRHQRMIALIEADPEAQKLLDEHFKARAAGQQTDAVRDRLKPISEYDDERDWLMDNMQHLQGAGRQPAQPDPVAQVESQLRTRDPQHYDTVVQRLPEFAQKLTVQQYQRVNSDFAALCKFYDYVKDQVVGPPAPKPAAGNQAATGDPSFRVKSGSAGPSDDSDGDPKVWEMSREKFQAHLDKVKGLA